MREPRFFDPVRWKENDVFRAAGVGESYDMVTGAFDRLLAGYGYVREGLCYRAEHPNTRTLVFFCHLGVSCVLLSHLMHVSPMVLWHGTCMAPSSVTTVCTEERRSGIAFFRVSSLGDTSHLYARGASPSFSGRFCEVFGNGERVD